MFFLTPSVGVRRNILLLGMAQEKKTGLHARSSVQKTPIPLTLFSVRNKGISIVPFDVQ
jgi:hypothetical protein